MQITTEEDLMLLIHTKYWAKVDEAGSTISKGAKHTFFETVISEVHGLYGDKFGFATTSELKARYTPWRKNRKRRDTLHSEQLQAEPPLQVPKKKERQYFTLDPMWVTNYNIT